MKTELLDKKDIQRVIEILDHNGLVAFPTDTVFGLACKMDKEAILKVYKAKGRDFNKPLPMMCNGPKMIEKVATISSDARKIMDHFMPGAITIVYKKKEEVEDYITQGLPTIGIRVPDDEWILNLIDELNTPIMVTSANISGNASLLEWKNVYDCMKDKIDAVVMEDARGQSASTIVDASSEIKVLRQGPISLEMIKEIL